MNLAEAASRASYFVTLYHEEASRRRRIFGNATIRIVMLNLIQHP